MTKEMVAVKRTSATTRPPSRSAILAEDRRRAAEADAERRRAARLRSRDRERPGMEWYAIHTHPLWERRVEIGLERMGLCIYLPEGRRWFKPRRSPHYVSRERPAFPRYLFIAYPDRRRPDVKLVDGVVGVVGTGRFGDPVKITETQIADMRAAQDMGALDFGKNPTRFDQGQRVEIMHPMMRGAKGLIVSGRIDGGYKVDLGWLSTMPILSVDLLRELA